MKHFNFLTFFSLIIALIYSCSPPSPNSTFQLENLLKKNPNKNELEFWDNSVWKTPFKDNLSQEEKIAGLSKLWMEVKYNFAFFNQLKGFNWDQQYFKYLPKVMSTTTTLEYYKLLMELTAKLKDGHTYISAPRELHKKIYARPPFRTQLIEDKIIVSDLDDPTGNDLLEVGDEILSINNVAVKDYALKNVIPYIKASTPQDLNYQTYERFLLAGPENSNISVRFLKQDGIQREIIYQRKDNRFYQTLKSIDYKLLDDNVAHLQINNFASQKVVSEFEKIFPKIQQSNALIIDLRNNGGGNTKFALEILAYLTDKEFIKTKWKTRIYLPVFRSWKMLLNGWYSNENQFLLNQKENFSKPIALLIGPRTFSTAEDFTVMFRELGLGKIIGEKSAGSSGNPLVIALPGGGNAKICTKVNTYKNGKEFVGVGIIPDIAVSQTISDFRQGTDTALVKAVKFLSLSKN